MASMIPEAGVTLFLTDYNPSASLGLLDSHFPRTLEMERGFRLTRACPLPSSVNALKDTHALIHFSPLNVCCPTLWTHTLSLVYQTETS